MIVRQVRLFAALACLAALQAGGVACAKDASPAAGDPFAHWAAVFVAGEWHAAGGVPTEGFDRARRDVTAAFETAGFAPANFAELSVRPTLYPNEKLYPAEKLELSNIANLEAELTRVAAVGTAGCFVYITTHGSPYGVPVGTDLLTPSKAAEIIGRACGERPTVVLLSACFSGVFVPALAGPNRMVLTAARPDRTSFGCGQNDKYPYFDDCILKSLPDAHDFMQLGEQAQICVAERERAEHLYPPSQPQIYVGAAIEPLIDASAFLKPGAQTAEAAPPPAPRRKPKRR